LSGHRDSNEARLFTKVADADGALSLLNDCIIYPTCNQATKEADSFAAAANKAHKRGWLGEQAAEEIKVRIVGAGHYTAERGSG